MSKNCLYYKFFNGCYKCGKADHSTKYCKTQKSKLVEACYKCGKEDHYVKNCPKNLKNINNNVDFID